MHRETLLLTREGRDVPIVVLANPAVSSPAQAEASGKPVITIQANIHGGEVEGKEASLIGCAIFCSETSSICWTIRY